MTRPDIIVSQVVKAPLEAVWESWADFGSIYKFHEDILRTTILTDETPRGVGAARLCELSDGKNVIEEKIVDWKPMEKIGIEFELTSLPIADARADFLFERLGDSRVQVHMQFSFRPGGQMLCLMKPVMKRKMQAGFAQLPLNNKRYLEQRQV